MSELREHFSDAEIAELGMMIGQYISLGRLLVIAGGKSNSLGKNYKMKTLV